ncbi:vinculin-like isoform X3 [Ostrinia furnacalis]|nr:vinculin-like isoform X3 [Ostrinia furnacalis]
MSLQTYNVLKTADMLSQEPNNIARRRKLLDACRQLNDAINQLVKTTTQSSRLHRECGALTRSLQLQQALLAAPLPAAALRYGDAMAALQNQRDVIQKLSNDEAMSREEFARTLSYVSSAVCNSTEYAAQCAYLLAIADQNKDVATDGFIDASRIRSLSEAVQDTCHRMIRTDVEQAKAEELVLSKQTQDLQQAVSEAKDRSREGPLKDRLAHAGASIDSAAKALHAAVNQKTPDKAKLTSYTIRLLDCVKAVDGAVESASLAPEVKNISADAKARSDEVLKNTRTLNNNMVSLVREVRAGEDDDPMTWVTFGTSRKAVLDAFEALFNSVKENGKRAGVLESSQSDDEEADQPKKSYVQIQLDLANKWLARPTVKPDVKTAGEEASSNIIKIGEQLAEDLKDNEREEMLQLTQDSKALLTDCAKKYDNQKARALMERLKELKKSIERGVVTRIVEDFLEGHEPLADLDILAEIEKDETKRKFLLERKIAELLAHLARVSKTARIAAGAGSGGPQRAEDLIQCSDQTELLAPMLVKAAQQRVMSPDDKAAIEHYQKLLAEYAESLANMRNLCDQAVDPMDFVQTAGETMQRLREDTAQEDDPQKCAYASTAITKLANRVINVSMSSNDVRKDPELQKLLKEAKEKLKATVPPPNARASRVPDWKVTTAEILRTTGEVESVLGGEMIFNKQQGADQPIFAAARDLHSAVRGWSARDNDIVAVAKRMAVLMAKLSDYMNTDRKREVLSTSKAIVMESHEVAELARKLANECTDVRIKTNLLQVCERIPTISGQLKMLATVKGSSLGHQDLKEDQEDMIMLVGNAQNLMLSVQEVVKAAASASVKIESQRGGPRMRWVRKNYY